MAEVLGANGSLTYTNLTVGIRDWTLTYDADALEVTDYGDSTARIYVPGLTSWSATATGWWDAANTAVPINSATLTLNINGTSNYSGAAIITNLTITSVVDAVITASFSFQGTSTLTPA